MYMRVNFTVTKRDVAGNVSTMERGRVPVGGDGEHAVTTRCRVCGKVSTKLYQNNTCKTCLVDSFKRLKVMIDSYRSGQEEALGHGSVDDR